MMDLIKDTCQLIVGLTVMAAVFSLIYIVFDGWAWDLPHYIFCGSVAGILCSGIGLLAGEM